MKSSDKPVVIIDTSEQRPFVFRNLPWVRQSLETGDYSIAGLVDYVAVERKSLTDLLGCFGTERERFKKTMQRMVAHPFRLLIVETDAETLRAGAWRHSSQSPAVVLGSLASWSCRYGLPIWLGGSPEACAEFLERWLYQAARHMVERYEAADAAVQQWKQLVGEGDG